MGNTICSPGHTRPFDSLAVKPLLTWLLIHMAALALPAGQIPLSDAFPRPIEQFAAHELVVVQVCLSSLLFPVLLQTAASMVMLIAATLPFIQLAGFLAAIPQQRLLLAAGYLALWLMTLRLWQSVVTTRRAELLSVTVAATLSIGGLLLLYLRAEFGTTPDFARAASSRFWLGPGVDVLRLLQADATEIKFWLPIGALVCVSLICQQLSRRRTSRDN